MALGTNHTTNVSADAFIPELWSDEVIASYKQATVMSNIVSRLLHKGKRGDSIHIPTPGRGEASRKVASSQVNLVNDLAGDINVLIDQHFEFSRLIEDITEVQALSSMRQFYTDDAGFGLAKAVDRELHGLSVEYNGGTKAGADWAGAFSGADGTTAFDNTNPVATSGDLTDLSLRAAIQRMDETDSPMQGRYMVLPPVAKNDLLGINRYVSDEFAARGGNSPVKTGILGDLYGVEIFHSTAVPYLHHNSVDDSIATTFTAAAPTGAAFVDAYGNVSDWTAATDTVFRAIPIAHKDASVLVEQMGVTSQVQYLQEYLGTLYTSHTIFGRAMLRPEAGTALIIPA
jgi:hypothetical protein